MTNPAPNPAAPLDLQALADEALDRAHDASAGRSARNLTSGQGARLSQTILAMVEGTRLQEHRAPGPATIQVLRGRVLVGTVDGSTSVDAGQWAPIPEELHDVLAMRDAALLLTVVAA